MADSPDETSSATFNGNGAPAQGTPFLDDLRAVLGEVQASLRALLAMLPGPLANASDLRRTLSLDTRLSTQLFRIAKAEDVTVVAADVPGPPSMRRFLQAMDRPGVDKAEAARLEAAMTAFERFVVSHAGDRVRFESIMSNLGARGQDNIERQHRRAAFRAMSHLLGMQVGVYLRTAIIGQSSSGGIDMAQVRGFHQVARLRPGTPIPLFSAKLLVTEDTPVSGPFRSKLVLGERLGGTHIGIASQDPPGIAKHLHLVEEIGMQSVELRGSGLGARELASFHFTQADFAVPVQVAAQPENVGINHTFSLPAEQFVLDVLCERSLLSAAGPSAKVYLNRTGRVALAFREEDQLEIQPAVTSFMSLKGLAKASPWSGYTETVNGVISAMGWESRNFDLFRVRLEYPVVGTMLRVGMNILPK